MSVRARLKAAVNGALGRRAIADAPVHQDAWRALTSLRREVRALRTQVSDAATHTAALARDVDRWLASEHVRVADRASLAAIPTARLRSGLIVLEGNPSERIRARRVAVGEPVERIYSASIGLRRCITDAADVRPRWESLLASEAAAGRDVLRSDPATVLDVPDARVAFDSSRRLRISMTGARARTGRPTAVPQFAYAFPPRKRRNFAHWLLDCSPQLAALLAVAPDAVVLLPDPILPFQEATLSLLGLDGERVVAWTGGALDCQRVVAFESDGRAGGGRPLSALLELRRLVCPPPDGSSRPRRRIFVSRRDAKAQRRWAANEPDIESLFRSRGFDIVCISDSSLRDVAGMFGEADVVAGLNGAGLAHILFSPPTTRLIVLFTDSLIRWHADEDGSRSLWTRRVEGSGELSAFGDSPYFFVHTAAAFGQTSHALVAPDSIPLDRLAEFLDEALEEVERA